MHETELYFSGLVEKEKERLQQMMETQKYYTFRYSILPVGFLQNENQIAMKLKSEKIKDFNEDGKAIEESSSTKNEIYTLDKISAFKMVIDNLEITSKKTIECNEDTYKLYFIKKLTPVSVLLQLGKMKPVMLNEETDYSIEPKEFQDLPNSYIIINFEEQLCLIQKNSNFALLPTTISNKFALCINKIFNELKLPFIFKIEPMTYSNDFWSAITKYQGDIKYVEFRFLSPNFLGASYKATE